MNAFRKYAIWIVGLGLAAFIIPSTIGSFGKFNENTKPSVKQPKKPYEPPFRMDGTLDRTILLACNIVFDFL